MRIIYDYQCFVRQEYGGISRYFFEIISRIKKNNDVKIKALKSQNYYFSNQLGKYQYKSKIEWYFMRLVNAFFFRIDLFFHKRKYDIFHSTYYVDYGKFIRGTKLKYVITVHDMIHEIFWNDKKNLGAQFIIKQKKKAIYHSDHIIAVSKNTKNDLLRIYPDIPPEKISVIYHGSYDYNNISNVNMKLRFGDYILFVGNRNSYKNFDVFVDAIHIVLQKHSQVRVLCVGGGKFSDEENELLSKKKIIGSFIQISATDEELINLYRGALCFVFPSLYEGFGIPILEAFSAGCPVLLSKSSCFGEIGGNAVLYFDGSNPQEMSDCILSVIENESLRTQMIKLGEKRKSDFSWEIAAQKTMDVYNNLKNQE